MNNNKVLFLYPDYYDSTTATRRILKSSKTLFHNLKIAYWARNGKLFDQKDELFESIQFEVYLESAPPRSFAVLLLFINFQYWTLKQIIKFKPDFVIAFTFYTILPTLIYRYFINWDCKIVYDPRDYIAVCYRINNFFVFCLRLLDNIWMQLSDLVIFPDNQFFNYYGMFRLRADKFYILPNSTEDIDSKLVKLDLHETYGIPKGSIVIPLIGYFSETRAKKLFYKVIKQNIENVYYIVAGEFRDQADIDFFNQQQNVIYLGKVHYNDALRIMKESTIVPLLYDPSSLNNKFAFPTKYYDSLMVGTPVLVSNGQVDVLEAINKYHLGYSIEYNNTNEFIALLNKIKLSGLDFDKKNIRKVFLEHYDFNLFSKGLSDKYYNLLKK